MDAQHKQYKDQYLTKDNPVEQALAQSGQAGSKWNVCPKCGMLNDPEAVFCESCGSPLNEKKCPRCGAVIYQEGDYCEHCKTYIDKKHCSFCGAGLSDDDTFCPECGMSRKGVVCPVCHTSNMFGFCSVCGTPLTELASKLLEEVRKNPQYGRMNTLSKELKTLSYKLPDDTPERQEVNRRNEALRARLLQMLNQPPTADDEKDLVPDAIKQLPLEEQIAKVRRELQALLDQTAVEACALPAMARNYAMAYKPVGSALGWKCNFKQAIHSGPFGCSCPQMGGKWIVLTGKEQKQLLDD